MKERQAFILMLLGIMKVVYRRCFQVSGEKITYRIADTPGL
jgi:hypothetical protein